MGIPLLLIFTIDYGNKNSKVSIMGIIYILKNKLDNKYYVGKTTNIFEKRFKQHQTSHSHIGNAIRKYSVNSFDRLVLENVPDEELDYWEQHYIQECNSISPNGYNLTYGGEGGKKSDETKKKISENSRGKKKPSFTEEHKKKISEALKRNAFTKKNKVWLGRTFTEEYKKKIKEVNKVRTLTEEQKKKISEAKKGNTNMYGKSHTEEAKQKMRIARKLYWEKNKIIFSEEAKQKMRIARKLYWEKKKIFDGKDKLL
jgi:group I intron endonuclease